MDSARRLLADMAPDFPPQYAGNLVTDTAEFMNIGHGDVIAVGGSHYLVLRDEAERRFGMEDPKFWVKRCRHLESGERRILKLEFFENFPVRIGSFEAHCYRSPQKESRILDLTRGDPRFMQGETFMDAGGHNVRVLEVVQGRRLDTLIEDLDMDHATYFRERFPEVLDRFLGACEALRFLHERGEKHGDVRRDHIFVEYQGGGWRWIDFDYAFDFHENPFGLDLFGLGNILVFLTAKGTPTPMSIPAEVAATLTGGDMSIVFGNRLVNLRKLYPYIPEDLNRVLLHFSAASEVFYDSVEELAGDLRACRARLGQGDAP
ncbi:serine/threonine protein kinase [Desulfovibrio aminophilus]|uniref:serine/threonine protein kinase n=1 Tax=Desulfovibrio aminophilus TaxID=81425 RepID=UPI0033988E27